MKLSAHLYGRVCFTLANAEKPVVAAVNGVAAGSGCNLALSCDIIFAAKSARFIEIFVRRGMIPDAAAPTSCPVPSVWSGPRSCSFPVIPWGPTRPWPWE
jgi:2-(1,2-epoxy-1,2-dihydrophenyl)acetyl-CoA isomerase